MVIKVTAIPAHMKKRAHVKQIKACLDMDITRVADDVKYIEFVMCFRG